MEYTIGQLCDVLSVCNLRIWMAEDVKRDPNATPEEIVKATNITNVANAQRNDAIQAIDEKINHMVKTGQTQKTYKQGSSKTYGKK